MYYIEYTFLNDLSTTRMYFFLSQESCYLTETVRRQWHQKAKRRMDGKHLTFGSWQWMSFVILTVVVMRFSISSKYIILFPDAKFSLFFTYNIISPKFVPIQLQSLIKSYRAWRMQLITCSLYLFCFSWHLYKIVF